MCVCREGGGAHMPHVIKNNYACHAIKFTNNFRNGRRGGALVLDPPLIFKTTDTLLVVENSCNYYFDSFNVSVKHYYVGFFF